MGGIDILSQEWQWKPLAYFNITHSFFTLNGHTIIFTWVALGVLLALGILIRPFLHQKNSRIRYLSISFAQAFMSLCNQAIGHFVYKHYVFITALFLFIFLCNTVAILPWIEEPTKDLNTTLAMGLVTFLYIQYYAIKTHGISGYLKEFFTPIFVMFPLHVVGKLSTVISMSFRLFGNIFGGYAIGHFYHMVVQQSVIFQFLGLISGIDLLMTLFFVLFEGFLQAFVFTMLSITYLSIALTHEESGDIA